MRRKDLMRELHAAGLRLDDASTAADVSVRVLRHERNRTIVQARIAGLTMRQIASVFDLDVAMIHRVLTRADVKSTSNCPTVRAPDTE